MIEYVISASTLVIYRKENEEHKKVIVSAYYNDEIFLTNVEEYRLLLNHLYGGRWAVGAKITGFMTTKRPFVTHGEALLIASNSKQILDYNKEIERLQSLLKYEEEIKAHNSNVTNDSYKQSNYSIPFLNFTIENLTNDDPLDLDSFYQRKTNLKKI